MIRRNPTLSLALLLTLLVELTLMFLVSLKVGEERIEFQIVRLGFQALALFLLFDRERRLLTILIVFLHFLAFARLFYEISIQQGYLIMAYHLIQGFIIYQRDWMDKVVFKRTG